VYKGERATFIYRLLNCEGVCMNDTAQNKLFVPPNSQSQEGKGNFVVMDTKNPTEISAR
jgi:hypothetical protein